MVTAGTTYTPDIQSNFYNISSDGQSVFLEGSGQVEYYIVIDGIGSIKKNTLLSVIGIGYDNY